MKWIVNLKSWSLGLAAILLIGVAGCSNSETASEPGESSGAATAEVDHSHSGYWCVEHGVPEAECARCDKSLVAKFKEDGDWCEEHDRPESQCFICSPQRAEKFIAQYEAKTGHKPPEPTE